MTDDPSFVIAVATGVLFALGWFPLRARLPRLLPLHPAHTVEHGPMLFVFGMFVALLAGTLLTPWMGIDLEAPDPSLSQIMIVQTLSSVLGFGLIVTIVAKRDGHAASIGLTRHHGPSPWIIGPCAWLAYLPVLLVVMLGNEWLHRTFGWERENQRALELFQSSEDAQRSPWLWLSMAVLIPVLEEIAFRGLLYGGLRRVFTAPVAIGFSAAIFAALHDPSHFLPVAALGVLLAWTYERTGSLYAPCIVHALHNATTLIMVSQGLSA